MHDRLVHVVVENQGDAGLLQHLLPPRILERCKFLASHGKGSAVSNARTLLITSKQPVAVLVNADTEDQEQVAEEQSMLNELMGTALDSARSKALLAVPNLETAANSHAAASGKSVVTLLIDFIDSVPEPERAAA